jgi:Zn-dependent protease
MQIKGVNVYVHWSVLLIAAILLLNAVNRPVMVLAGMACWLGILLIHECGHLLVAQRKKCHVFEIEIYPILGVIRYEPPWSRVDHGLIAWGGVAAQAVVAIPCVALILVFGYSRFEIVNEVLVLLGFFSLLIAAFNLLPFPPLDGATAWKLIPALYTMARNHRKRPPTPRYRSSW